MEKKQYELCIEVLRRLDNAKVLKNIIVIGSWCIPFYKKYFTKVKYFSSIKTRDIDFLIPSPLKIQTKIDIPELLKDIGFIISFKGSKGYIKLEHPELIIEFLVPEKGRGLDKPYPLPQLGLNAQTLRFLDFLTMNTIRLKIEGILVTLPHPANFALHKLIIFHRRIKEEKALKDRNASVRILKTLIKEGKTRAIKKAFSSVNKKWQRRIINSLKSIGEEEIVNILNSNLLDITRSI